MRWRLLGLVIVVAFGASGCRAFSVDAPISFKADHRLEMVSPEDEDEMGVPTRIEWEVEDFDLTGGNHFGLFVDRAPLGQGKELRLRICTENEQKPIAPGEDRKPCDDDRETIFFTTDTSFELPCLPQREGVPEDRRNNHRVTIILLDEDNQRVGSAATSVVFNVTDAAARKCRGL